MSDVDVRRAECLKREDTKAILAELDRKVGLVECNKLVHGLLNLVISSAGVQHTHRHVTGVEKSWDCGAREASCRRFAKVSSKSKVRVCTNGEFNIA